MNEITGSNRKHPEPPPFILFYDANNKLKQAKCVILEHFLSARLYTICNTDFFRRMYIGGLHVSDTVSPRGGGGGGVGWWGASSCRYSNRWQAAVLIMYKEEVPLYGL